MRLQHKPVDPLRHYAMMLVCLRRAQVSRLPSFVKRIRDALSELGCPNAADGASVAPLRDVDGGVAPSERPCPVFIMTNCRDDDMLDALEATLPGHVRYRPPYFQFADEGRVLVRELSLTTTCSCVEVWRLETPR